MKKEIYDNVEILWEYLYYENELEKADLIIGFGSNDLTTAQIAINLFKDGWAPNIVFSGGLGKGTKDWKKSEAEVFAEIAISQGVLPEKILIEKSSTNTGENIQYTKDLIKAKGIKVNKIIVVHQPNMGKRIYAALKKQWNDINIIIAPNRISLSSYLETMKINNVDENEVINNIVGDFQRMDTYAKLGYQIHMDLPNTALTSYNKLVELGYNKYVMT